MAIERNLRRAATVRFRQPFDDGGPDAETALRRPGRVGVGVEEVRRGPHTSLSQPCWITKRTRSAQPLKPSFCIALARYVSTVLTLNSRRIAISLFKTAWSNLMLGGLRGTVDHAVASNPASSFIRAAVSTGLTKWWSNPASALFCRSSSWPQPVRATSTMSLPHGCSRMRRHAS